MFTNLWRKLFIILVVAFFPGLLFGAQGTLDPSFHGSGSTTFTTLDIGNRPNAVAVQRDGKIVVADTFPGSQFGPHVNVIRYHTDGTLDTSFGTAGSVMYDPDHAFATDVAIQKDGKIVVAGMRLNDDTAEYELLLLRYNTNGTLDAGFGTGGVVIYVNHQGANGFATVNKLAIQDDGKIVVAGYTEGPDSDKDMLLLRYNTNGTLDGGFGSGGVVTFTDFVYNDPSADPEVHLAFPEVYARDVKIMPDGSIAVLIQSATCVTVLKYSSTGAFVSQYKPFCGDIAVPGYGLAATAQSMDVQEDGKIVVVGEVGLIYALRYGTDGQFDRTFGISTPKGANVFDYPTFFGSDPDGAGWCSVHDVVIQPDGKILVLGNIPFDHTGDHFSDEQDLLVLRLDSAGAYDPMFGDRGAFVFDGGARTEPLEGDLGISLAIQPNGDIIVAGDSIAPATTDGHYDLLVLRILGEPLADIEVLPTAVDFGDVTVASNKTLQVTLYNKG